MRSLICTGIACLLLISLAACSANTDICGIWEQEMETAILGEGIEEATAVVSIHRFTFREDGTGVQEHIMMDCSHPNAVREFAWQQDGDSLFLDYGGGHTEEFTVTASKTKLKLKNSRGSYELKSVK